VVRLFVLALTFNAWQKIIVSEIRVTMRRSKSAFCPRIPRRRRISELKFVRETRGKEPEEMRGDLGEARLVPTPHLTANKVTVGNTDWGNAMAFLTAGKRRPRRRPAAAADPSHLGARGALRRAGRASRAPSDDRTTGPSPHRRKRRGRSTSAASCSTARRLRWPTRSTRSTSPATSRCSAVDVLRGHHFRLGAPGAQRGAQTDWRDSGARPHDSRT